MKVWEMQITDAMGISEYIDPVLIVRFNDDGSFEVGNGYNHYTYPSETKISIYQIDRKSK